MSENWHIEQEVRVQIKLTEKEVLNLRNTVLFALENLGAVEDYLDVDLNAVALDSVYEKLSDAKKIMIGG